MYLIILLLPTLGACIGYWDFLAKRISLPLSAALYSPDPESCLQDRVGAYSVEKFMAKVDGGSVSGLIVTIPFLQTVALSFMADISEPTDFNSFKELFFPLVKWQYEGKVSKFLQQAFKNLWRHGNMKKRFQKILEERGNQKVLITGHSFGGALAALVAVDIIKKGLAKKDTVTLITLGQSMVGDKDFAKEYEEEVRDSYRVVRRGDSIPHVPGREHGYEFNGREVFYERYEMRSDGFTGFKICKPHSDVDEEGCSGSQTNPVRAIYNDKYFRRNVTEYGLKCK
ncbi:hypothetical protein Aduo_010108 [Ancylostoma duodenale]